MNPKDYPVEVRPLAADDGGGWLATFPDLPGCMGDGETPEAAIVDGYAAAQAWLTVAKECGDPIPNPCTGGESGRFVARVPKSLHTRLVARALQEGVSMNTYLVSVLAQSVGERTHA
jgi:antitoxin HicB